MLVMERVLASSSTGDGLESQFSTWSFSSISTHIQPTASRTFPAIGVPSGYSHTLGENHRATTSSSSAPMSIQAPSSNSHFTSSSSSSWLTRQIASPTQPVANRPIRVSEPQSQTTTVPQESLHTTSLLTTSLNASTSFTSSASSVSANPPVHVVASTRITLEPPVNAFTHKSRFSQGEIIGIVIGAVAAALVVSALIWSIARLCRIYPCGRRGLRKHKDSEAAPDLQAFEADSNSAIVPYMEGTVVPYDRSIGSRSVTPNSGITAIGKRPLLLLDPTPASTSSASVNTYYTPAPSPSPAQLYAEISQLRVAVSELQEHVAADLSMASPRSRRRREIPPTYSTAISLPVTPAHSDFRM